MLGAAAVVTGSSAVLLHPRIASRFAHGSEGLSHYTEHWLEQYCAAFAVVAGSLGILALVALRRRLSLDRWLRAHRVALGRLCLTAAAVAGSLLLAEVLLRVIARDGVRPGDLERASASFLERTRSQLNDRGYRDGPFPRDGDGPRILVLGDSFVYGCGVERVEDTFPRQLEDALRGRPGLENARVFNAGIPGADTPRTLRTAKELLPLLRPTRVVLGYHFNDIESRELQQEFRRSERLVPVFSNYALRASAVWRVLEPAMLRVLHHVGQGQSYDFHLRRLYDPDQGRWTEHRLELLELFQLVRDAGAELSVVLFPVVTDFTHYPFDEAHRQLRSLCAECGVPCFDLLDVFRDQDPAELRVSPTDAHLDEAATHAAAQAAAAALPWN